MREIEKEYFEGIEDARSQHYESAVRALNYIQQSTAKYHGRCVRTLYLPKIFTGDNIADFRGIIQTLYGIFDKVINRYVQDADYRKLFRFDSRLEELILLKPLYEARIPVARIDIFYNEENGNFKFCEFNTDGTSAMNEDRELNEALRLTLAYERFTGKKNVHTFELFDTLASELKKIYDTTPDAKEHPHCAIVDFMDCATENEFLIAAQALERKGCSAQLCEIRDLTYDGKHLYSPDGKQIDMIYRRAVTCDIMAHYDEVTPFLQAVKDGNVCLLGDFRTQIVHNKIFYQVVRQEQTLSMLTDRERMFVQKHFPYTERYVPGAVSTEMLLENREKWILKPEDSYGSKGVFAGVEYEQEEWEKIVKEQYGRDYIVQEFCTPYRTINIDLMKDPHASCREYSNITGLYVYNASFYGIYSRIAECSVISTQYSEMAIPTIVAE